MNIHSNSLRHLVNIGTITMKDMEETGDTLLIKAVKSITKTNKFTEIEQLLLFEAMKANINTNSRVNNGSTFTINTKSLPMQFLHQLPLVNKAKNCLQEHCRKYYAK